MKTELDYDDIKELIFLMIRQAQSDYIHYFFPKNGKQKKALGTAEGFLFDDNYSIDFGGQERTLKDLLDIINEHDREPMNIDLMRTEVNKKAYQHNMLGLNEKKDAQITLDLLGVIRDNAPHKEDS